MTRAVTIGLVALVAALSAVPNAASQASSVSETAVKAAFLFNFAKFTDWKPDGTSAPLSLCVLGDEGVARALAGTVGATRIGGKALAVRQVDPDEASRTCDLLFVAASQTRRAAAVLQVLRTRPVLTVSDGAAFARTGGIIELVGDADRLRFAINTDAADRAGLRLSSRLLGLATIVRDTHGR